MDRGRLPGEGRDVLRAVDAALVAFAAFAALFLATTQITSLRLASPFAEDPFDLAASVVVLVVPVVLGVTLVRRLRHSSGPPPATERLLWRGASIAIAAVGVVLAGDVVAEALVPAHSGAAGSVVVALLGLTAIAWAGAATVVTTTHRRPDDVTAGASSGAAADTLDDILALVASGLDRVAPHRTAAWRGVAAAIAAWLHRSELSPRRHRLVSGIVVAVVSSVAGVALHAWREGPWLSPHAAIVFALVAAASILAGWSLAVWPLGAIRPAARSHHDDPPVRPARRT